MKGLFEQPTIMHELLRCITPLEYMVLRRVFSVFSRKPRIYPSVNTFIGDIEKKWDCSGLALLAILNKTVYVSQPKKAKSKVTHISGALFTKSRGLMVRDIYPLIECAFVVDTGYYMQNALVKRLSAPTMATCFMGEVKSYMECGYRILIQHDAIGLEYAILKQTSEMSCREIRCVMDGVRNPKECVTTFECGCANYNSPRSACSNNHKCDCRHHVLYLQVALERWNTHERKRLADAFHNTLAIYLIRVGEEKNMYQLIAP